MEDWEEDGEAQLSKYTTKTLFKEHLSQPWDTFSIGTHDGFSSGCHDLQAILPSNQCQESWHNQLMSLLKSSGNLRGSTEKAF